MAIRSLELFCRWTVSRTYTQPVGTRSIWLSSDHDFLPVMDDCDDSHPRLCTIPTCPGSGRGIMWYFMGCLPGKLFPRTRAMTQLTRGLLPRHFPQHMLAKLFPRFSDRMSLHMCACAGARVSSSRLALSAPSQESQATWLGNFLSFFSGCGQSPSS